MTDMTARPLQPTRRDTATAMLDAALAVLLAVTGWSTFDGLRRLMAGDAANDPVGAVLLPAGVTFGLVLALYVTPMRPPSRRSPPRSAGGSTRSERPLPIWRRWRAATSRSMRRRIWRTG